MNSVGTHTKKQKPQKKNQSELKDTLKKKKKKNTLDGINNRLDKAENQISNLEDEVLENTQSEEEKEKKI